MFLLHRLLWNISNNVPVLIIREKNDDLIISNYKIILN